MAYVEQPNFYETKVVDQFDCPHCRVGRAVVKARRFTNRWGFVNPEGKQNKLIHRYYTHCSVCDEVTGWKFTAEDARADFVDSRVLTGKFDRSGKFVLVDLAERPRRKTAKTKKEK